MIIYFMYNENKKEEIKMKDANGNIVKDGDKIKTERGAILNVIIEEDIYYVFHTGSEAISMLSTITVPFYIEEK